MPGKSQLTRALLLRSIDYGDTHRVVTLLTEEFGKINALARGARRSKKRFGGALQPGVLMRAAVRFGRGDLASLERVAADAVHLNLLKDLRRIQGLGDGLSLLRDLSPIDQPDRDVFAAAVEFLGVLDSTELVEEATVAFEARLLALVGFAPRVDACAGCGKKPGARQSAFFDPLQSSIVCRSCGGGRMRLSASARALLEASLAVDWPPRSAWGARELGEVRDVLRTVIEPLLNRARVPRSSGPGDVAQRPQG